MRRMEKIPIEEGPKVRTDVYISKRVRQVIQMGKSVGFTIPGKMARMMGIQIGDAVFVTLINRDQLVIEPIRPEGREGKENATPQEVSLHGS
jgi:antitoxin component of MazEF toxin-antitoxin module